MQLNTRRFFLFLGVMLVQMRVCADSVSFEALMEKAVKHHPSVVFEERQQAAAEGDLDAAKRRRFPLIAIKTEAPSGGGASSLGSAGAITAEQTVWSAGRDQALVDSAVATVDLHAAKVKEAQYQLALRIVESWQKLVQANFRMDEVQRKQLELSKYMALMKRRVAANASPSIELELVSSQAARSRLEYDQASASARSAETRLSVLVGESIDGELLGADAACLPCILRGVTISPLDNAKIVDVIDRHPSVVRATHEALAAAYDVKVQGATRWPQLYVRAQKSPSGGSSSYTDGIYFGLKFEPEAGFASVAKEAAAISRAEGYLAAVEVVKRELMSEILEDLRVFSAESDRSVEMSIAVTTTNKIQESYERQFVAGRRSWQEVMNAVRENSDYRLGYVDAIAEALGAAYRLRVRTSDLPWQRSNTSGVGR